MRKLMKAALAAGACMVLTGCPEITRVQGKVVDNSGNQAVAGGTAKSWSTLHVSPGASITLRSVTPIKGGKRTCEQTFTADFTVPVAITTNCREETQDEQDQNQNQDQNNTQDQPQDQNPSANDGANGSSGISAPEVTPSSVPDYSGINAPGVTPTPVPQFSGGGGGGIGGPQVVASSVPTFTRIMQVVNNPILTGTLSVIGAAAVVKEVHDQTNGDGDKPISK